MSLPTMKTFKMEYKKDTETNVIFYDILNSYQTNPLEVIKSKLIIRLGTAKGEWQKDPDFGIPLLAIKQNTNNPDVVAQLIADEILKVENVSGVKLIEKNVNSETRIFFANFEVSTIYGTTNVEVNV
jgi:hypothetical protein